MKVIKQIFLLLVLLIFINNKVNAKAITDLLAILFNDLSKLEASKKECISEKKAEICNQLGLYYEYKKKDLKKAQEFYQRACDLNNGVGCNNLATILYKTGKKNDLKKVENLLLKACNLNSMEGCYNLGLIYARQKELKKALPFLKKACNLRYAEACYLAGGIYAKLYQIDLSVLYYKKACIIGYKQACFLLSTVCQYGFRIACKALFNF